MADIIQFNNEILDSNGSTIASKEDVCYSILDVLQVLHPKDLLVIPRNTTTIAANAYKHNYDIKTVFLPDALTEIGDNAFYNCYNLNTVKIPDNVKSIGDEVFRSCSRLEHITFGNSVESIGDYALSSCDRLTNIILPSSVTSIGENAFNGCNIENITIPKSVTYIGKAAFASCYNLNWFNVEAGNTVYQTIDGNLYSKDGKALVAYAGGKTDTIFTVPSSVTTINDQAFERCRKLINITITDSVTTIGTDAFYDCYNLETVVIGDSVTAIGAGAFNNCSSLTNITIPKSINSIGENALHSTIANITFKGTGTELRNLVQTTNLLAGISECTVTCTNEILNIKDGNILTTLASGTYTFNDTITFSKDIEQALDFSSSKKVPQFGTTSYTYYSKMYVNASSGYISYVPEYGDETVAYTIDNGWYSNFNQYDNTIIKLDSEQTVTEDFYNWFINNTN